MRKQWRTWSRTTTTMSGTRCFSNETFRIFQRVFFILCIYVSTFVIFAATMKKTLDRKAVRAFHAEDGDMDEKDLSMASEGCA